MSASSDLPPAPETAPPPADNPNSLQRFVGAIVAPTRTFASIVAKPDVLIPLIAYAVFALVTAMLILPHVDFETAMREQFETTQPNMKADDVDRMVNISAAFAKGAFYASPVTSVIIYLALAGIFLLAFRLAGADGDYKQALSVVLYAWVPMLIKSLATVIIVLARGEVDLTQMQNVVMSNLGFLVDQKKQMVLYSLLSSIDVFTIWTLALMTIGFSYMAKRSRAFAGTIVFSLWAVVVVIKVRFAALGAARLKQS